MKHEPSCSWAESHHKSGENCDACADLLPCPHCGSTNIMKNVSPMARVEDKWIKCVGCGISTQGYKTFKKATAVWNRRPGKERKG